MYWRLEQGMAAAMGLSPRSAWRWRRWSPSVIPGVELKWPNDLPLAYQGPQAGGILVEMSSSAGASCHR